MKLDYRTKCVSKLYQKNARKAEQNKAGKEGKDTLYILSYFTSKLNIMKKKSFFVFSKVPKSYNQWRLLLG